MQNKTKLFLVSVVVFVVGGLMARGVKAETATPWCCVPNVGAGCNDTTSAVNTCDAGYTLKTVACSTVSTCVQYVAPTTTPSTTPATTPSTGAGITFPTDTGLPTNPDLIRGIVTNIADWLLSIIGIIAVISFIISGVQYFLVATDEKMLETAKKTMMTSIIGIVVALFGYIAVRTVEMLLHG